MSHPSWLSRCASPAGRWCFQVGGFGPERCLCHGSYKRSLIRPKARGCLKYTAASCQQPTITRSTEYPTQVVGDSCPCEEQTIHQSSRLSSQAGSSHTAETTSHQGDQATQITRHSAGRTGRPGPTQVICHRLIELQSARLGISRLDEAVQPQRSRAAPTQHQLQATRSIESPSNGFGARPGYVIRFPNPGPPCPEEPKAESPSLPAHAKIASPRTPTETGWACPCNRHGLETGQRRESE